ncbi:hypothetical protein HXX76_005487 [Chlamydomonas incerta]|uniref:DUF1990 domain-containing protein n=1 Tax=Chlamydomonas incerta TaxID=51695 RepID=A0A835THL2_CHLIN|nr:hypothetical protein HXX76_005487 [Chlamydomonas incerta]|eukprot:KAG2437870.1 hypothetical protein HXX76_005487 [Chlamydomonas incerta]
MVHLALWRPSLADELRVKQEGSRNNLNYARDLVGTTKEPAAVRALAKKGWIVDSVSVKVGEGEKAYKAARACLQRWGHFQLGWSNVDPRTGVSAGTVLAVTSKTLFLWNCNPLRVVYNQQQEPPKLRLPWAPRPAQSFRFAHGCLDGHMLTGEESFSVEMRPDGSVWYDILTFSKPLHPLAVGFFPLTRFFQHKFGQESAAALARAVREATVAAAPSK